VTTEDAPIELLERDEQLKQLNQAFAVASAGHGRIVAIAAEAGAGKTALIEHFVGRHADQAALHWGACENLSTPEILLPLRDIARAAGESLDTSADHVRLFEWLLRLVSNTAIPSILVIEDLHWGDTATLDLLRFLARRIARVRVLLLITYRDEEVNARSPIRHLLGEATPGSVERMTLQPLSLYAVAQLAVKAGRSAEDVYALTAGNPFLVTESLAATQATPTDAVRDATLARVSRLSAAARSVLEAVSIFPRRAETAIVAELLSFGLDAALDECIEKGMLWLDGGIVRFRHELARMAIEASIAPTTRRELHRKVVNELRRRRGSRAGEIAHHAERAGEAEALLEFSKIAGDEAAAAGAPREAASHYGRMLQHRDVLENTLLMKTLECHAEQSYLTGDSLSAMASMTEAAQLRREAADVIGLGRNLTRLTRFAWMCGRRPEAERYVKDAIDVLQAVPPGAELAWAFSHQSQLDMLAFRMDSAIEWGERAFTLATSLGEKEISVHALSNLGSARAELGDWAGGKELEQSFELAVAGRYHDHVERAACNLTCMHYWHRDHPASLRQIERGIAYAVTRELTHWEGYLRGWRAMIHLDLGDWAAAEEEAQEISCRQFIADVYRFPALIALARLRLRRGEPDDGMPLEGARRLSASLGELQRTVYVAVIQAERCWLNDVDAAERNEAIALLREVRDLAADRHARWVADNAVLWLHLLGETDSEMSGLSAPFRDHCEGRWQAAAAGWAKLGQPYERAMALSMGDDDARREALSLFDRLGAVPAASRLRRELRASGARAIPRGPIAETRANVAGLTRRQTRVLELIAEGMTNSEIAERLCISGKTAEHHVSAIMSRFEAGTRREAVASARKLGMLGAKDGGAEHQR
jgi:DNA-binding CsgD family transcriptional regulator/tetratricopeptide (TPR) repeat protein